MDTIAKARSKKYAAQVWAGIIEDDAALSQEKDRRRKALEDMLAERARHVKEFRDA